MKLFRVGGISLELHPTFYLLPLYVVGQGWWDEGAHGALTALLALVLVYTSVVLHEFGHALTAKKLGIPVRQIVLLPIGGMALLERLPRNPVKELLIIAAGPAVNFVIVGICLVLGHGWPAHLERYAEPSLHPGGILRFLLLSNLVLGCFNLLPAFPMDGGRIVRALLAFPFDYVRATRYAVIIGRCVALAGIVFALYDKSFLLAILFGFILVIGAREYQHVLYEELHS
jgi:Zn-dependent protease